MYQGKPRKNVCILSTVYAGVDTFSGAKAKPESVMYFKNTKYSEDVLDQMARVYSVKGGTRRWPVSSMISSTWLGSMPASYSRSISSRIARRKVPQQLAEKLRAEYMEGKGAAAVIYKILCKFIQ